MKQKIQPQGFIDALTHQEFMDGLTRHNDALLQILGRNARFIRDIEQTQAGAGGAFQINVSPPDGFLWEIRGIKFASPTAATTANLFINDSGSALNLVDTFLASDTLRAHLYNKTLIVHSNDVLQFVQGSVPPAANDMCAFQLYIIEVPNSHEAQLLL